jgi:hypothetical protein
MRKTLLKVFLSVVVLCMGANFAMAVDGKIIMVAKMEPVNGGPVKGEIRAITVSDHTSSLGFYSPTGGSYEVPGEKVIIMKKGKL